MDLSSLDFKPLTEKTWGDFVSLFGERGACGGCWCMTYRLTHADYEQMKGEGNKMAMLGLVREKSPLGVLAYESGTAIGWCSVSPREQLTRLTTSRILAPVDDRPVWSIACFYIERPYRGKGVSKALAEAAVKYAGEEGAEMVEAYPVEPKKDKIPPVFAFNGLYTVFLSCGFEEVERRSPTRPVMRLNLHPNKQVNL